MIEWIAEHLLPFSIVDEDEIGIFLRGGKYTKSLKAGVYFTIPFWDSVRVVNKNETPLELKDQAFTINGKAYMASVYISYSIFDAKKALLEQENYEESLGNEALCLTTELEADMIEVEDELHGMAEGWGIEIHQVRLDQKAPCRVFRIVQ